MPVRYETPDSGFGWRLTAAETAEHLRQLDAQWSREASGVECARREAVGEARETLRQLRHLGRP
jgi:hypothetical protein